MSNRTKRGASGRTVAPSFDDRNFAVQTQLQQQVAITTRRRATAQGVKVALDLRQAARSAAYADAQENAATAATNFSAAQLATQTLVEGLKKGAVAKTQAGHIREKLGELAAQAYQTAEHVCEVATCVDRLVADVQARLGKNQPLSPFFRSDAPQAAADAQKALTAVLAALQDCVRAYSAASVADAVAAEPVKLGEELLKMLVVKPTAAEKRAEETLSSGEGKAPPPEFYTTIKNVSALRLWLREPSSIHQVAAALHRDSARGLLNLLSAVKTVTHLRETVANEALTVTILEDNKAQNELDRTTQKLNLLQAALNAADAALA